MAIREITIGNLPETSVRGSFDAASLSGGILTLRAVLGHRVERVLRTDGALQDAA